MNKQLRDLIEIIHFTERVATKIHGIMDEAEIFSMVKKEFVKSKRYTASMMLLTDDGTKLRFVGTSVAPRKVRLGEKIVGRRLKEYKIDLKKSKTYQQVVREGKTVQVSTTEIIAELLPRSLARMVSKTFGYQRKKCILTPLEQNSKVIGVFAMTSTDLTEYFIPSVKNLAQHISTALELASECAKHKQTGKKLIQLVDSQKEFVASVGHELRTPLSVIKAVAESELDDFQLINKKVDQMALILKNLMLVSRLETGQELLQRKKIELSSLLKNVWQEVANEARQENFEPRVVFNCPETIAFKGDPTKIALILANLLRNAVFHSNGRPCLTLKVKKLSNKIQIVVEDDNQPIPKKELEKIFEKFYRGPQVRKKAGGLGLGLYISQRLAELMGGKIWAENKDDQGNRIIVQLPD